MIARNDEEDLRPSIFLAHSDAAYLLQAARRFRKLGWEVIMAPSGHETRRLAGLRLPTAVVLDVDLPDESGWLTCAKLTGELPWLKVILVAEDPTDEQQRFAEFVGAAGIVDRSCGVKPLLDEVIDEPVSLVG